MAIQVSYMGTKKQLAPYVSEVALELKKGPLLDLFSGICAVGTELSSKRQIWSNDVMSFPNLVAKSLFQIQENGFDLTQVKPKLEILYEINLRKLAKRFEQPLAEEASAIEKKSVLAVREFNLNLAHVGNSNLLNKERLRLSKALKTSPYRLFSITFAGGYFSLLQAIQIDSIRYAIDVANSKKIINEDQKSLCLLALCQAVSKCSTSPGHFAQYITPKLKNKRYYFKQRSKNIWENWIRQFDTIKPIRNPIWRTKNKVFQSDALDLLDNLKKSAQKPAIIYADPPYTDDQYSRYYHLYETLIKYDYPASSGIGRYRPDRFKSDFSLKSKVDTAFKGLIEKTSALGADIIISYPSAGCMSDSVDKIMALLEAHYPIAGIAQNLEHQHSTMGGSKGVSKNTAHEIIFYARKGQKK